MTFRDIDLSRELVQAVRDAADVVAVAREHTELRQKAGADWEGLCPLHKEKTPSFHVDADKGLFYCFGCGAGGDAIKLHMLLTGDDFPAAIESLALRHGIPVRERRRRRADEPDVEGALAAAADFFRDRLAEGGTAGRYLAEREIPDELVERYELGYAPDGWTNLLDALAGRVRERDLEAAGLVRRSSRGTLIDSFRHRLIFPVHNPSGRLVGFGGRTLGDDQPKYVNTAETERFHKGELLYGLFQARREIRDRGRAVLVEGYFDVLGAAAAGVEGAVATMGTALTPEQARLLARYAEEAVVAYDGDDAGERAHRRALPILLGAGLAVHRAELPDGHDPDSLRRALGGRAVVRAVETAPDAVLAEIERLVPHDAAREPRLQARAASDLGELLGRVPDAVLRFSYARRAAERLDLPVEVLLQRVPGGAGRPGRGARPPPAAPAEPRAASPVRSLEETALELLLTGGGVAGAVPPAADLPPDEAFLDPVCRNIYRTYRALYESGTGRPPDARAVMAELGDAGGGDRPAAGAGDDADRDAREGGGLDAPVDRLARLLLGSSFGPSERATSDRARTGERASGPALTDCLDKLTRRWRQQRLRDLSREISRAQREGDRARLESLLNEKTDLSRRLHRGA